MVFETIPAEWRDNGGNSNYAENNKLIQHNTNVNSIELIRKLIKISPSIPGIHNKQRTLGKSLGPGSIDEDFQRRPDALSNSHFKDMPKLIRVTETITGHYTPGFTESEDDLLSRPRNINKIHKNNEMGIGKTLTKNLSGLKIHALEETSAVSHRNKFTNHSTVDGDRESYKPIQIVPIQQYTEIIDVVQ